MRIYRIEHKDRKSGMWYSEKAEHKDYFNTEIPMDKDEIFRSNGKEWFSGTTSIDNLKEWFDRGFTEKMLDEGYIILTFKANETIRLEDQVLFTREGIVGKIRELTIDDIYEPKTASDIFIFEELILG